MDGSGASPVTRFTIPTQLLKPSQQQPIQSTATTLDGTPRPHPNRTPDNSARIVRFFTHVHARAREQRKKTCDHEVRTIELD